MGVHRNITHNTFPRQGTTVGSRVKVCFHFDVNHTIEGEVVRDDAEVMIIKLDDERFVLSTECQYSFLK